MTDTDLTGLPEWMQQQVKTSEENIKARKKAEVVQLPLWGEVERAIPNHIARSSLFAPIARGRRKLHDKALLISRSDARMFYSGKQLDEADCDVYMQFLHEAKQVPLGEPVTINRAEFLRKIGRNTGKSAYTWLHESIERLCFAMLSIETKKYEIGTTPRSRILHLIDGFDHDPETDTYILKIDPRLQVMFGHSEYALIDWEKRLQISHRIDLAKRLQRLVATSNDRMQHYSLDYLKEVCCHEGRMRDFKSALSEALEELERLHIIKNHRIEISSKGKEQALWQRGKE